MVRRASGCDDRGDAARRATRQRRRVDRSHFSCRAAAPAAAARRAARYEDGAQRSQRAAAVRLRRLGAPRTRAVRRRTGRRRGERAADVYGPERRRPRADAAQAVVSLPAARDAALGADRAGDPARRPGAAGQSRFDLQQSTEVTGSAWADSGPAYNPAWMALIAGSRLGPYEIEAALGEG